MFVFRQSQSSRQIHAHGLALPRLRIDADLEGDRLANGDFIAFSQGWRVVEFFEDAGISGAKGRDKRPRLDRLLKAVARRDVDMVAFLRELHAKGVDLFLHQQGLDTSTPSGRAMFQMLGVFAEFERAMIRERVMAGLSRAKAEGTQLGRCRLEDSDAGKVAAIVTARANGTGIRRIARELGVGVGTVLRVTGADTA
jgi:DNA invertase Pin-like site-specific DNA recombinase